MEVTVPRLCPVIIKEVLFAEWAFLSFNLTRVHDVLTILHRICNQMLIVWKIRMNPIDPSTIRIILDRSDGGLSQRPIQLTLFGSNDGVINSLGISECQVTDLIPSIKEIDILNFGKTNQEVPHLIYIHLSR
ncbi:MAG: hypothetical protein NC131_11360 [Roseburia sp.]|nr:hypothetical protein [Roseburia sp.]